MPFRQFFKGTYKFQIYNLKTDHLTRAGRSFFSYVAADVGLKRPDEILLTHHPFKQCMTVRDL